MKLNLLLCAALACGTALAHATPDQPSDYGWSMSLTVPAGAGVARLPLPKEVYLHARTGNLADVRLLDRDGQRLPFAISTPPAQANTQRSSIAARIFPVTGSAAGGGGLQNVEIRTGNDGRLLSVSASAGGGTATAGKTLQALILDIGPQTPGSRIGALRFTPPANAGDYSAQVLLEVSDDLKQWDGAGTTTLNWLSNSDTQTLANDSIVFAPRAFRYARLSWQDGQPLVFAAIAAQAVSQTEAAPPRASIVLQGVAGKQANEWRYATPIAIPADSIALQFAQANVVLPVTLGVYRQNNYVPQRRLHLQRQTRPAQGEYFDPLLSTSFYRISDAGKERVSGELAMPVVQTTQWILRPQTEGTALPASAPSLRLGWTPETLVFLAGGKPPYRLVFGKADAQPVAQPLSQVAPGYRDGELQALPIATVGALTARAGAADVAPARQEKGPPWRLAALWAALLLGVGVLGFFAWRLLSQMKQEQPPH
ncbi:DUF3999 family protein [Janthinobacterium psychrotolerans]|uniref:DUF3999 domain-containing protein n=1 Tax=Janthinobacterium psychrotolerans TaxID=1747903 RepID=A0A1A7BW26_9BURK|nr:DUF3999 family protein [Janthinobacterium psychrotolerans]OBV36725.1 Protein of unknown function (DUF3999) [Janthinobacterium psychrotolerans]